MRSLADRLEVKAASLYWHVRDRRELMELLAEGVLESVGRPRRRATWRENVLATAEAFRRRVAAQKDGSRILLEVPEALNRSDTFRDLSTELQSAGLQPAEAAEVAMMVMTQSMAAPASTETAAVETGGGPASINIDTGSRGVILRAGPVEMQGLIRIPPEQGGAAPAVVRGENVVVRRLRGVGRGEIELNPRRPWKFNVQAPTWNTVVDAAGLDVRAIHIDSGAVNVECFLPIPTGIVPIHVSSGVVNVAIHRAREAAVVATVHTGAFKVRLDDFSTRVTVSDVHWQSTGAHESRDRYELGVSSGVVDFNLDTYTPKSQPAAAAPASAPIKSKPASGLDFLLDGVEARMKSRR